VPRHLKNKNRTNPVRCNMHSKDCSLPPLGREVAPTDAEDHRSRRRRKQRENLEHTRRAENQLPYHRTGFFWGVPRMGRWPACSRSLLSVESSEGRNVPMVECSAASITSFVVSGSAVDSESSWSWSWSCGGRDVIERRRRDRRKARRVAVRGRGAL
jgi:hypothetical protein